MTEILNPKVIGRINLQTERAIGTDMKCDTNVYLSIERQIHLEEKYQDNYQILLKNFNRILKQPNFVRLSTTKDDLLYISTIIKNGVLRAYKLHVAYENEKWELTDCGFLDNNEIKLLDSLSSFKKIF